jgi:phosphoribosylcarboxyaminoimidazole (NCAIR) mutase
MFGLNGIIRATARPTVGRPVYGERLNHEPVLTSTVQQVIGQGIALVRTKNSWYLVLAPAPAQAAHAR